MIVAHIISSLRETFPARASEWGLTACVFSWGMTLSATPTLLDNALYFKAMASILSQEKWMLICFTISISRFIALAINGLWRRTPHVRAFLAFISALFWFEISLGLFQATPISTGAGVYAVLFCMEVFNVFRAMGDAGRLDAVHKAASNGNNY